MCDDEEGFGGEEECGYHMLRTVPGTEDRRIRSYERYFTFVTLF